MEYISKELMYSRGSTYDKARSRNNVNSLSNIERRLSEQWQGQAQLKLSGHRNLLPAPTGQTASRRKHSEEQFQEQVQRKYV